MKLSVLKIRNFRCCESFEIEIGSMHALVGANNAGKSTVLHALDLLFNPTTRKISEESFYLGDIQRRIEVEGLFTDLSAEESAKLAAYLRPDGSFQVMRTVEVAEAGVDGGDSEAKFKISQHYAKPVPTIDWLDQTKISGASIDAWWKLKDDLVFRGVSFQSLLGSAKPGVAVWKEKAEEFARANLLPGDFRDLWIANPQGYAGVLKGSLPHYEIIPAVRDATDESKVTKSNPFGRLIYEIVETIDSDLRKELDESLKQTVIKLNRSGAEKRAPKVAEVEGAIKSYLAELMPADLELEFQAPTVEVLLTTPRVLVNDGFKGGVEGKGHGLQRAVIFAILRAYARLVTERADAQKRTLILGVEEPELYMHPTAQRTIRKVLKAIANGGDQVLITTHSPLMVDVEFFDEIVRVEPAISGGSPVPYQLPVVSLIDDLVARFPALSGTVSAESIREKYRHAYTPTRNEGFFAKTVVLVEGQTEVYSLPVYASALGVDFDALGIAVVECGGKGQIDRLYRVFNELGVPCFVLFDYDTDNTDKSAKRETKMLLSLLGVKADDEPAGPVVSESFAFFAKDWESDLAHQIVDYAALKAEAKESLGLRDESKPLVARYVASRVSAKGEESVPEVLREIVGRIVAVRRTKSCLHNALAVANVADVAVAVEAAVGT